ncbi:MAG: cupin domain-containing protein, partial [Gammaproteobacteria bacterium]|nr:cupin domain-containing protein [Gammaproteobacteria bacterium]
VPDISIDYALMEKSPSAAVVPCDIGWSDIGAWTSLGELVPADDHGNRRRGEVIFSDARNNYIDSPRRLTAALGVDDLIVVDTVDALLVAHRDRAQDVKNIVSELKRQNHEAHLLHQTVYRPWGSYTTLEEGDRFKIKRIEVKPGASLSLQMHHHRSEHWIVVSGLARVTNDDKEFYLRANESTFILAGHQHRLANPDITSLVLIEVQSGDYLGEDDIVRFEDNYGRA